MVLNGYFWTFCIFMSELRNIYRMRRVWLFIEPQKQFQFTIFTFKTILAISISFWISKLNKFRLLNGHWYSPNVANHFVVLQTIGNYLKSYFRWLVFSLTLLTEILWNVTFAIVTPTSQHRLRKWQKKVAEIFREKFIITNVVCDHLWKRRFRWM